VNTVGQQRILIACIGNIFLGDDGFGVEVAQRLSTRHYPEGVHVVDFGIRGMDLAYAMLEHYDTLVLVDTVSRGGSPGTLYLLEINLAADNLEQTSQIMPDAHSMDPVKVFAFAKMLGAQPVRTLLIGCEPVPPEAEEDCQEGLSEPVQAAIDEAVKMIDSLVAVPAG
jgi:hydrogenase maturation protease